MKQGKRKGSGKKPQLGKAKLPYQKRLTLGFAKVEKDLSWLMGAFQELLAELGEEKVEKALPFRLGFRIVLPSFSDFKSGMKLRVIGVHSHFCRIGNFLIC